VKKLKRKGFGWTRWSSETVYGTWGLFDDYRVRYPARESGVRRKGLITPT
jgi:hypothetical protein